MSNLPEADKQNRWPELCTLKDRLQELERKEAEAHWENFIESDDPWGPTYRIVKQKISPSVSERFPGSGRKSFYENLKVLFPGIRLEPPERTPLLDITEQGNPRLKWAKVTADWLHERTQKASTRKAPGIDGITGKILRQVPGKFTARLALGINECLRLSHFPEELKTASIVMIPKPGKGNYSEPKAFRPISLLPWAGKTLEYVINEHLQPLLEAKLHKQQHGFRSGKSTITALLELDGFACSRRHRKKALLAIDFQGAFDSAPHQRILRQLERWNVPDQMVRILASYLDNRSVTYQGHTYWMSAIGCPQGSVLAPALWNVLVNSLVEELNKHHLAVAYADDLTVCVDGGDSGELERSLGAAIRMVRRWSLSNGLTISESKTVILPVHTDWAEDIEGIRCVPATKVLGVILDSKWRFKDHVTNQIEKGRKLLQTWNRYVSRDNRLYKSSRLLFVKGALRPMLAYGIELWGDRVSDDTLRGLEKLERKALLSALGAYRTSSYNDLHTIGKMVTLKDHIASLTAVQTGEPTHVRVNKLKYPRLALRRIPEERVDENVVVRSHLHQAQDYVIGQVELEWSSLYFREVYKFSADQEWKELEQWMISELIYMLPDLALTKSNVFLQTDTSVTGSKVIRKPWKKLQDSLRHRSTRMYSAAPWDSPPIIPREEHENMAISSPVASVRLTRKLIRKRKTEEYKETGKEDVKKLLNIEKYPFREQVWLATGHGPWPDYLARFHVKRVACACGLEGADWRHLAQCTDLGRNLLDPAKVFRPSYAAAIARRAQSLAGASRLRHLPAAIPLQSTNDIQARE